MNPEQLLERFSTHLRNIIAKAMAVATAFQHEKVTPLHIFIVLLDETGSIAQEIMKKNAIDKKFVLALLENSPELRGQTGKTQTATIPELDNSTKKILERAMLFAYENGHTHVGTEHLLLSLMRSNNSLIKEILNKFKVNSKDIEEQVENIMHSTSKFPDIEDVSEIMDKLEDIAGQDSALPLPPPQMENRPINSLKAKKLDATALELFTTSLTDKNSQKNIDPVIGREREIERLINILSRRTKNNPVLIGEPGVGKTAIVEGLAKKIAEGNVPDILKRKKILSLDMTLLIAGTIYRGEFEARLKQIVEEIGRSPDVILFIDELHNIIGAGSSAGAMDAANILKPALARGLLRCIGATTIDEYKKHLASDPALERRFQAINVEEPSKEETMKILSGIKKYYESFHNVKITDEAIAAAVELSIKYVHDNFLPDKAIDLLDEASAAVKTKTKLMPDQIKQQKLENEIEDCLAQKELAIKQEKFEQALGLKKRGENLQKELRLLEEKISKTKKIPPKKVEKKDIAKVLENKLGVKAEVLLASQWEELESLPRRLEQKIIGQTEAIEKIIKTLRQSYLGLKNNKKPLASLLFVGPSGVGKTELAKILAQELYHDEKALIKLDMSEFSEGHSTSKLLGSPAGYIGHKERNHFTDEIRKRPYCVVLLDEIDKAHRDVTKLLLQILGEGELTDSSGKKTYFNHAVIILTSNLGAELFKSSGIGFGKKDDNSKNLEKSITTKLKEELSTALVSRLDNIIVFKLLTQKNIEKIVESNLQEINKKLMRNNSLSFKTPEKTVSALADKAFSEEEGARNVEKILQDTIQEVIVEILRNKKHKANYQLLMKNGEYKLV